MRGGLAHCGCPLESARAVAVMLHGRDRDTADILTIAERIALDNIAYVAPAADDNSWYPERFMEPLAANQPWLDHALARVHSIVSDLQNRNGVDAARIVLVGFSQGACLALEYAVRHARRYGAIAGLTGGLIGPPGTRWNNGGNFDGTPVYLGTSDVDEWVPLSRVRESATIMRKLGAKVDVEVFAGMGHIVNDREIARVRELMETVAGLSTRVI